MVWLLLLGGALHAQAPLGQPPLSSSPPTLGVPLDAAITLHLYHLEELAAQLKAQQAERQPPGSACTATPEATATLAQLSTRAAFAEAIQVSALDVDSVLAELSNERGELSDLRASLQQKRDRSVARYTYAALITGSAIGAGVSATQFPQLSSTVQTTGDAVGIGAGVASTLFSVLANRRQAGPSGTVQQSPNMLAPLLGGKPNLQTGYTQEIINFLNSLPEDPGEAPITRLASLKLSWTRAGRLLAPGAKGEQDKLAALTASNDPAVKVTIADLTDRIAMLSDVMGRISLLRRDLAGVARFYLRPAGQCDATSPATSR